MLWALLFSLIFSGGDETIVINAEVKKLLRNNMSDGDRKEYALNLTKSYMDEVKYFNKIQKKRLKQLQSVFKERNSTSSDFLKLYEEYFSDLIIIQNKGIAGRKELQDILTEDEWQLILNSIDEDSAKVAKKKLKNRSKLNRKAGKFKIKATNHLKDTRKRQIVGAQLEIYTKEYMGYVEYRDGLKYYNNEVLRFQHSNTLEMANLLNERTEKRKKLFDEYIELHQILVQNTTEKEWGGVVRKMNRVF